MTAAEANEKYAEYLKGKRVALVGPASTALGTGKGKYIDDHDVVVRINKQFWAWDCWHDDIGSRTDVLYSCLVPTQTAGGIRLANKKFIRSQDYKFVVWGVMGKAMLREGFGSDLYSFKTVKNFLKVVGGKFPVPVIDTEHWRKAYWGCKGKPNTGTNAIWDILRYDIKSLYITGLSFYRTGYIPKYRNGLENPKRAKKHIIASSHASGENQLKYILSLIENDSRVVLDDFLLQQQLGSDKPTP